MDKIRALFKKYEAFISYVFFGGLTTLINLVVFWVTHEQMGINWAVANIIAWFLSVLFAFFTNKTWVFHSRYTTVWAFLKEIFLFFGARGASLVIDQSIMWIGIDLLHVGAMLTKLVDQIVVILINYVFSKWIFKKK